MIRNGPRIRRRQQVTIVKLLTRILAVVRKEIIEVLRRPGAVISLILGPFLIMALFGLGYSGIRRPLDTIIVIPPTSGLSSDLKQYQDLAGAGFTIRSITDDPNGAEALLRAQQV